MKKKRLSSSLTFFWKYVFPFVWIVGLTAGIIGAFSESVPEGLFLTAVFAFGFTMLYYAFLRAKVVHIDNRYLYINNINEKIKVPITNIKNVYDNALFNPRPIFIEFENETEFGNKIMFIGRTEFNFFFSTHSCVKEIRERAGM